MVKVRMMRVSGTMPISNPFLVTLNFKGFAMSASNIEYPMKKGKMMISKIVSKIVFKIALMVILI